MFGALARYLLGGDDDDDKGENEGAPKVGSLGKTPASEEETKQVQGAVTDLHPGYCLVDGQIFVSYDLFEGGNKPKVGSRVTVFARRKHETGGWRAERVYVSPLMERDWEEEIEGATAEDVVTKETVVTKIIRIIDGEVTTEDGTQFPLTDILSDYVPYKGDWITLTVEKSSIDCHTRVYDVKTLRRKEFEGTINAVMTGFGYVDSEIYYTYGVLSPGYKPRKGDKVIGEAIESSQGKATWRAVYMAPAKTSTPVMPGKM